MSFFKAFRGNHEDSGDLRQRMRRYQITQITSRTESCYDDSPIEQLFRSMKTASAEKGFVPLAVSEENLNSESGNF